MKTVQQIMEESNAKANMEAFMEMQQWPYALKIRHARQVARAFWEDARRRGYNCHVSVGGLDSIVLHYFLESIGIAVPVITCSSLEGRPHRFDLLRDKDPREWEFWMYNVATDADGKRYGWGRILDYIGVEWENAPGQLLGQLSMEEWYEGA